MISQGKLDFLIIKKRFLLKIFFSENKPARSFLNTLVAHNDDPTNTLVVRFADKDKLGVKEIKEYARKMQDEDITSTILIVQKGVTNMAREVNYFLEFEKKNKTSIF